MVVLILLCFLAVWLAAAFYQRKFNYEIGKNDCRHMSLRQARIFRKLGIEVSFRLAELEDQENHAFLKLSRFQIPFQPESLLPFPARFWFEHYVDEKEISKSDIDLPPEKNSGAKRID